MNNPGTYSFGDVALTAPGIYITDWIDDLDGVTTASIDLMFVYGGGSASGHVYVQTSIRQGTKTTDAGIDVACMAFDTATKNRLFNLSGLRSQTGPVTPSDGALADDSSVDGIFGDRFRLKIVTTGTYVAPTLLSGRIEAR